MENPELSPANAPIETPSSEEIGPQSTPVTISAPRRSASQPTEALHCGIVSSFLSISIMITAPNDDIPSLAKLPGANAWVAAHVSPFYLTVGNKIMVTGDRSLIAHLIPAMLSLSTPATPTAPLPSIAPPPVAFRRYLPCLEPLLPRPPSLSSVPSTPPHLRLQDRHRPPPPCRQSQLSA